MFTSPGEIAFYIGRLPIHYYGLCMALALSVGITVSYFICKKHYRELNSDIITNISIPIIIGGIIGARLYYCVLAYTYYVHHPIEILQIYNGGLSIHGGIFGGLIGGIIYAKKNKLPILQLCDIFSFAIVIGQIIGRWGNFFNSEAFGLPCNNFLKLYIPYSKRPFEYINYEYFHPTFLYEIFLNICILIILSIMLKKQVKTGTIFFTYLILYSIVRIFLETLRIDSILYIHGITIASIISVILILISILALRKI